jgi:hypothetical protein
MTAAREANRTRNIIDRTAATPRRLQACREIASVRLMAGGFNRVMGSPMEKGHVQDSIGLAFRSAQTGQEAKSG